MGSDPAATTLTAFTTVRYLDMDAAAKLGPLCYGGEQLLESATVDAGAIGITSHRVLVLMPDGTGPRFHAVDRPNVTGFTSEATGPTSHRDRGIVAGVIGAALLVTGAALDFGGLGGPLDALAGAESGDPSGLALVLVALFDDALHLLGLLALLAALGLMALYLWRAGWVIEIAIAGADSIRIPISRYEIEVVDRLEAALADARTDGATDGASTAPVGPT